MKEEIILDLDCFNIQETVCELSGMTTNQFINVCIRHYGEAVKEALARIAMSDIHNN